MIVVRIPLPGLVAMQLMLELVLITPGLVGVEEAWIRFRWERGWVGAIGRLALVVLDRPGPRRIQHPIPLDVLLPPCNEVFSFPNDVLGALFRPPGLRLAFPKDLVPARLLGEGLGGFGVQRWRWLLLLLRWWLWLWGMVGLELVDRPS